MAEYDNHMAAYDEVYNLVKAARTAEPVNTKALNDIRDTYGQHLYFAALNAVVDEMGNIEISQEELNRNLEYSTGIMYRKKEFRGVEFSTADPRFAELSDCRFYDCKFVGFNGFRLNFQGSVFTDCTFENVILERANLSNTGIYHSKFQEAALTRADLSGASIKHASFNDDVELSGAVMFGTHFDSVYFRNVKVTEPLQGLDEVSITMGGATSDEVENHRRQIFEALEPKESREYKYYSLRRPVSVGTYPLEDMKSYENYNGRTNVPSIGREAWGELIYSRALTANEIAEYELLPDPAIGKLTLEERLTGDELLNAKDAVEEITSRGGVVDKYGSVTVYHRTDKKNAERIYGTGVMIAKEDGLFFSTKENGQNVGYGDTSIKLEIPVEKLEVDDVFSDEVHFRLPLGTNRRMSVSEYLVAESELPHREEKIEFYTININSDSVPTYHDSFDTAIVEYMAAEQRQGEDLRAIGYTDENGKGGVILQRQGTVDVSMRDNISIDLEQEKYKPVKEALQKIDERLKKDNGAERGGKVAQEESVSVEATTDEMGAKEKLQAQLSDGIRGVMEQDSFRNWLKTNGRLYFNNYSFRNAMLTYIQKPEASYVMGYDKWKEFGRQVVKGASGIKIYAPRFAQEKVKGGLYNAVKYGLQKQLGENPALPLAVYDLGQSGLSFTLDRKGTMGYRMNGQERATFTDAEQARKFIDRYVIGKVPVYYNITTVFDVKDTYAPEILWVKSGYKKEDLVLNDNGDPIKSRRGEYQIRNTQERQERFNPDLDFTIPEQDTGKMELLYSVLKQVSEKKGIPMRLETANSDETLKSGAKGYFHRPVNLSDPADKGYIVIDGNLSATERVAVTFREMAHSDLHGNLAKLEAELGERADRSMREVQAEAAAYMTANQFGIETDTHSFTYLATWSKGKELQDLSKSLDVIYRESKALMKDIEAELDLRGLSLKLEPKRVEPMTTEQIQAIAAEQYKYVLDKSAVLHSLKSEIAEIYSATFDEFPRGVLQEQAKIVNTQMTDVATVDKLIKKFEQSTDGREQRETLQAIEAAKLRVVQGDNCFEHLTESYMNFQDYKQGNLKVEFDKDPAATLLLLKEKHKEMSELSQGDLDYLAKSKFVKREYSKLLRDNPQEFVNKAMERVQDAHAVAAKNGAFVEIGFCEQWGDTPYFKCGTLCHPKIANQIIEQAEVVSRSMKAKAQLSGEYYPYTKCDMMLFTKMEKGLVAFHTRVDIGDGEQTSLTEHLEQVCKRGTTKEQIMESYQKSLKERAVKDKILTPHDREANQAVIEKEQDAMEATADENNTQRIDEWRKDVDGRRENTGKQEPERDTKTTERG